MRNKRKMIVAVLVVLFVLGGMGFAFRANSALGRTVLGDGLIGVPVSDSEAAELVGGCSYYSFKQCSGAASCKSSCYYTCNIFCIDNYYNMKYEATSCGGGCGTFYSGPTSCNGG